MSRHVLLLTAGLLFAILGSQGCQQAPITFTETAPVTLANFDGSSAESSLEIERINQQIDLSFTPISLPHSSKVTEQHVWHQWQQGSATLSPLEQQAANNKLNITALMSHSVISQPSILQAALQYRRQDMANNAELSQAICLDSLQLRVRQHSLNIGIDCPAPLLTKMALINALLADDFLLSDKQLANIKRRLKLNKHINAFTGNEINRYYFAALLGPNHPYQQNIDNTDAIDALDSSFLNMALKHLQQQANWHYFSHLDIHQQAELKHQLVNAGSKAAAHTSSEMQTADKDTKPDAYHHANAANSTNKLAKRSADKLALLDAPDSVQSQVRYGFLLSKQPLALTPQQQLTNRLACESLAALLGRGYSGRLFYDLRETRGLTYGIYGYCNHAPLGQFITFYGSTALANSGAFIDGINQHITELQLNQISEAELAAVKRHLLGKSLLRIDSQAGKVSEMLLPMLFGQTTADTQAYFAALNALSVADIKHFANTYLQQPTIMVRGDTDKISTDLQQKLPSYQQYQLK